MSAESCCGVLGWGGMAQHSAKERTPKVYPRDQAVALWAGLTVVSQEVPKYSPFFPSLTQKSIIEPGTALLSFSDRIMYIYQQCFEACVAERS